MVERRLFGLSLLAVSNVLISLFLLIVGGALLFSPRETYQASEWEHFVFILLDTAILGLAFVCGVAGVDLWRLRKRGRSATIFFMCMFGFLGPLWIAQLWVRSAVLAFCLWAVVYLLRPKIRRKFDAVFGSVRSNSAVSSRGDSVSAGLSVAPTTNTFLTTPNFLRWRRVVDLASLGSPVCILCAYSIQTWRSSDWFPGLLIICPFWLPYVFIFFRLRGEQIKSGLSLAIAMGCAMIAPSVAVLSYAYEWEASWWIRGCIALLLVMQPILVSTAVRAYKSLPEEPRDWKKAAVSGTYGVLLFGLFWFTAIFGNFPSPVAYNESQAMESMRGAFMAADVYAKNHDGGFPENAATWGPEAKEDCRAYYEPRLASHQPECGYVFDYHGEPLNRLIHGCGVAQSYAVTARPSVFGKTGRRSFFVDQTHIIRFTLENRPPTASDPPIPPESLPPL